MNVSFFIGNVVEEYICPATSSNVRGRHKNIQNKNIHAIWFRQSGLHRQQKVIEGSAVFGKINGEQLNLPV